MRRPARYSVLNVGVLRLVVLVALTIAVACSSDNVASPGGTGTTGTTTSGTTTSGDKAGFVVSTPLKEGIDTAALSAMIADAKAQHSEALIVVKNGKLVYEDYFGTKDEPMPTNSMSKSMVSLAYGYLLADGKLASLDEPIMKVLPSFATVDARKAGMTYRHLLSMTSGINPARPLDSNDIEATANTSLVFFTPGTSWQYANEGVNVLSMLVGKLAGKPLDTYLNEKLFAPLGISSASWDLRDRNGVPYGDGEMLIRPLDLAKIGQTILNGGTWNGNSVIRSDWIDQSQLQSSSFAPDYGLLWWRSVNSPLRIGVTDDLLTQWTGNGLLDAITAKVKTLVGTSFTTLASCKAAAASVLTPDEAATLAHFEQTGDHIDTYRYTVSSPGDSRYAEGWLGQYLDIVSDKQLVVVRMRRPRASDYVNPTAETDNYPTILSDIARLVP